MDKAETKIFISTNYEDKSTLLCAVRVHKKYGKKWIARVRETWMAHDDHDQYSTGSCNFVIESMSELQELVVALHAAKIRRWHLWFSVEDEAIRTTGSLGFRSDDDMMAKVHIDWDKLNDQARVKVKEAISVLESIQ